MKKLFSTLLLSLMLALLTHVSAYSLDNEAVGKKLEAGKNSKELLQTFFTCVADSVTQHTLEMEVPEKNLGDIAWESCSDDYFAYEIVRASEAGSQVTEADMDLLNCKGKFYTSYQVIELMQKDLSRAFSILKKNMEKVE